MKIYTVGHSHRTLEQLLALLGEQGIGCVVDVRSQPGSARFPHFNRPALARALEQAGIDYLWEGQALGGRRPRSPEDARHRALGAGFRSFATHMGTPAFRAGIDRLLERARCRRTVLLCTEKDPSRCHRALIADYLTVRGYDLRHLIDPGVAKRHGLHPAAWLEGQTLVYHPAPDAADLCATGS
ncbi:DUF488 domain-containing protein [Candidatus Methylocalor cossyra]|uniref:DUF488 domain-containing protein n=1 Tax=Candidatus Methylocalor cossyra TaxID=3108543 RepID=A0ABM9NGV7_9GAMM